MKKILLLCIIAFSVQFAEARVINVSDHGIVPGKDVTYQLNRLIRSVQDESDVTLVFPKGQYDLYPDNAVEIYRSVSNHDNGLKRMAFPLFNHNNITIDGGGSLFMFHGRMVPFTLESVRGATLKNFSIDWIRSFHAELTVVECD
ncbi:MAG: right-handed parallel beta-helix repeat-containing protein, partial [Planctomycetes bacterium]|nr:right-handed parallel beta-helix repeat-containing protein [Planctomycetota bacterium]